MRSQPSYEVARRKSPGVPFFFPDWLEIHEIVRTVRGFLSMYARGALLDVGCGEKPFFSYRPSAIVEWIGLDTPGNPHAELHGFADAIPATDASFDTVICTQVMEHVADPSKALAEIFRVMTPGGHLLITAPQFWPVHEAPYDFYRYTPYGLKHLLENAGFEIVDHVVNGSGFRVAAQAFNLTVSACGERLPAGKTKWVRALFVPVYVSANLAAVVLDRLFPDRMNILNNAFIAKRPAS